MAATVVPGSAASMRAPVVRTSSRFRAASARMRLKVHPSVTVRTVNASCVWHLSATVVRQKGADMITYDKLFLGGAWVEPSNPELLDIASPHDRSVIGRAAQ